MPFDTCIPVASWLPKHPLWPQCSPPHITSEGNVNAEYTEEENEKKKIGPCIRVIVIGSPVFYTGSLFIITAVKPAAIGRENDPEHAL